jgi:enoyl-CoA hydratase/carnithine racemase
MIDLCSGDCNPVRFEIKDQIGYLVLNAPPENRMTTQFFTKLHERINEIECIDSIKGLIICSEGRHFSSGADLKDLAKVVSGKKAENLCTMDYQKSTLDENVKIFSSLSNLKIPVIAAIHGVCIGSALELVLCADIRICEHRTTLGFPEVQFNLMPGCGGTVRLPLLTGVGTALNLMLTGDLIGADDAFTYGVVDIVVERKKAVLTGIELIRIAYQKNIKKESFRKSILELFYAGKTSIECI